MAANEKSEPVAEASRVGSTPVAAPSTSAAVPQEGHWVEERPEPGLARGTYAWPEWGVAVFGGVIALVGVVHLVTRYHRSRKR